MVVIVPNLYNLYAQSNINWPYVDCQIRAVLMHGVPVMALTATATHVMKSVALALGTYQGTVVKRSSNQPNEVERKMQSFAEEEFEK